MPKLRMPGILLPLPHTFLWSGLKRRDTNYYLITKYLKLYFDMFLYMSVSYSKEEHRLRALENKVLKRLFEPK
jgi:hypothetical protein